MKKSLSMLAMGAAALGFALAPAISAQNANRMAAADNTFATKAAEGGMAEVQLGKLAQTNASSSDVKSFGDRMVTDHTKAADELMNLAGKRGITLPSTPNAKQQAEYNRLAKLHGADFDREYMKLMISDHRTDVNEFKREADHGSDPDMKAYAAKTLPVLQEHLQLAESTDAKVKNEK